MADTYTANYNLRKADPASSYSVGIVNDNLDAIDGAIAQVAGHDTTITVTTTWSGASAPYTQNVAVSGVTTGQQLFIQILDSATEEQSKAWDLISKAYVSATNTVTFVCNEEKPTATIPLQVYW